MEYILNDKQVVMNFSENFCKNEIEVLNSDCFKDVLKRYIDHLYKTENQAFLPTLNLIPRTKTADVLVRLFKLIFSLSFKDIEALEDKGGIINKVLEKRYVLYDLVQDFYNYWRRIERYSIVLSRVTKDGVEASSFIQAQTEFNDTVLSTYRTISEKLYGEKFSIYRQLPAGVNASLLLSNNDLLNSLTLS